MARTRKGQVITLKQAIMHDYVSINSYSGNFAVALG